MRKLFAIFLFVAITLPGQTPYSNRAAAKTTQHLFDLLPREKQDRIR